MWRIANEQKRSALLAASAIMAFFAASLWGVASAPAQVHNPHGVAVIIGNRDYAYTEKVAYAHRDTDAFKEYVTDLLGFDPKRVIHLRNVTLTQMIEVFGNEREFKGEVWRLLDQGGRSDVVVFYSGHGVPGLRDKRGYLVPVNARPDTVELSGYPIEVLYANLGKLNKARSVVVYLDACFSGDSHAGMLFERASPVKIRAALPKEVGRRVTVLTAASGKEVASWDDSARHGLFTNHLLSALYGAGDSDKDGRVTAGEAKSYLDRHMTEAARKIRRVQNASLMGSKDAVLSVARFPERPSLGGGKKAGEKPKKKMKEKVAKAVKPIPIAEKEADLDRKKKVFVQRGLASLKFDPGPVDGAFGPKTREAIRYWQKAKGYEETGRLTKEQADALVAVGEEIKVAVGIYPKPVARPGRAPGTALRDCPDCPEMVVVPAGSFMMGSPSHEAGRDSDEGPRHRVTIAKPFAVGKYEVTFAEWDACVAAGGCGGYRPDDGGWGRGRRPTINVNWDDAKAYVRWLSRKTGKPYRLPSEAEWEYAARAETSTPFHFGSTISTSQANYDGNYMYGGGVKGVYRERTVTVGSFPANGFGLHDAHSNVREWVEDCWNSNYAGAPADGSARMSGDCWNRVLRGGSWFFRPGYLRSAFRFRSGTGNRSGDGGFRVARTLDP